MAAEQAGSLRLLFGADVAELTGEQPGVLVVRILTASDADEKGWMTFQTKTSDEYLFNVHVQNGEEAPFVADAIRGRYLQINSLSLEQPDLNYNVTCHRKITLSPLYDDDVVKVLKHSEVVASAPTAAVLDMTVPITPLPDIAPNHCYNVIGYLESGGLVGKEKASWAGRLVTAFETVEVFLSPSTVSACTDVGKPLPRAGNLVVLIGFRCDAAYYQDKFFRRVRAVTGSDWFDSALDSLVSEEQLAAANLYKHATATKPLLGVRPSHYKDIEAATPFDSLASKPDGNYVIAAILRGAAITARTDTIADWRCGNWVSSTEHPCVEKDDGIYCKQCRMTVANAKAVYLMKIYIDVPVGRQELRIFEHAGNALTGYSSCSAFLTAQRALSAKQRETTKMSVIDKTRNTKAILGVWKKDGYLNIMLLQLMGAASQQAPSQPFTPPPRPRAPKRARAADVADD